MGILNKWFHLKERNTSVRVEVIAGITTFMAMAYILAVNPNILSATGMDRGALFVSTALASAIGCFCMAFSNLPFGLAPGMGLNAYFAYTVCIGMGCSWQFALAAIFVEGIIFILLSVLDVRESIFNAIPKSLKLGISSGIGLFIAFIGLLNSKVVVMDTSTAVTRFSFKVNPFESVGITVVLTIIGILLTAILLIHNVKGSILIGILATWGLGMLCQFFGWYVPNPDLGMYSLFPDFSNGFTVPSIKPILFKLDFMAVVNNFGNFLIIMLTFLFGDCFDTLGTLMGVATKSNMLDKDGKLPGIKGALIADAIATSAGALLGVSTTTTYVESSAGTAEGGRTGLTAIVIGLLFLLSLFVSPLFLTIPSFATAPALITVGFMMVTAFSDIDRDDLSEAIPAYIAMIAMPFMYSIAEGISLGVISYTVINACTGRAKKVHPIMYILTILFVLRYAFL